MLLHTLAHPKTTVSECIDRTFQQNLYLIDKKPMVGDDPDLPSARKFFILGATRNILHGLNLKPSCT